MIVICANYRGLIGLHNWEALGPDLGKKSES